MMQVLYVVGAVISAALGVGLLILGITGFVHCYDRTPLSIFPWPCVLHLVWWIPAVLAFGGGAWLYSTRPRP